MLTAKQGAFCRAYAGSGDAAAAYRCAFRADRLKAATVAARAAALLARDEIATRVATLRSGDAPQAGAVTWMDRDETAPAVDRAWVLRRLVMNVERALQLVPARERAGTSAGLAYNGAVANRALELIGKELGMFIERREIRAGPLAGRTDDELNALIQRLLRELELDPRDEALGAAPANERPVDARMS